MTLPALNIPLRAAAALAVCASFSCYQDYTFTTYTDPNLGIAARLIELQPAVLDFGHVDKYGSASQEVTVRNIGTSNLYLLEVEVDGYPTFSAQSPKQDILAPQEETTIPITYNPAGFERAIASLIVRSNDPILPEVTAGLAGRSSPPQLRISPPAFDFGLEFVGCPLSHQITLSNVGEGELLITELGLASDDDDFRVGFDPAATLPLGLMPGESQTVVLDYRPSGDGADEVTVQITSNDPDRPVAEAPAYGHGRLEGHVTDRFDQVANNRTDILFVVDNSFSMNEEQETLTCNFENFLNVVDTLEIDYQIAVITTDSPILQGEEKVITPESIDPTVTFAENAQVGVDGFGQETGFEMAAQALSYPLISSQNEGFLRPQAGLRVIMVSDENDQSQAAVQEYVDFFRNLKANPSDVIISAIVGDPNGGCGFESEPQPKLMSTAPSASPALKATPTSECPQRECGRAIGGDRYVEAVQLTGGIFGSICSCNFIEALESIAYETIHLVDTFPLTQDPIVETLEVYVDDIADESWRYDEESNAIVFDDPDTVPTNGQRVRVEYDLRAYCED